MARPPLRKGTSGPTPPKKMQLSSQRPRRTLLDLRKGDVAVLDSIDLPAEDARRLMELGFLPGTPVTAGQSAPGGDPRVFRVDGSEIALRRATAAQLILRSEPKRPM